jgi:cephalosporin hydroxylase
MRKLFVKLYYFFLSPFVNKFFFRDLIRTTHNFSDTKWAGHPIWQNVLDLWTIQETIFEVKPALLIECGTNRGGSALFYAHLFDLMGQGNIVTIDVEKLHDLTHPRVTFLHGSSTSPEIVELVRKRVAETRGPILVILDSDHSKAHVLRELECYAPFVTRGSFCLVQDGVIDTIPAFKSLRPGPLPAVEEFMKGNSNFEIDLERTQRFIVTHHPKGWLRRL